MAHFFKKNITLQDFLYNLSLSKPCKMWEAAIALWICLRLPSCGNEFESQAHHLCIL